MSEPVPFGDLISELASTWNPAREADAKACAAFLTGALSIICGDEEQTHLKTKCVEIDLDEHGNYLPYFIVTTASGVRIRVTVTPEFDSKLVGYVRGE